MMLEWTDVEEIVKKFHNQFNKQENVNLPESMSKQIMEAADQVFNPIEALDANQVKILTEIKQIRNYLDEMTKLKNEIESKINRYTVLRNNFTSSVELKHNLIDQVWRVNEKTSMIEVFDKARALKNIKEMGIGEMLPSDLFGDSNNQ